MRPRKASGTVTTASDDPRNVDLLGGGVNVSASTFPPELQLEIESDRLKPAWRNTTKIHPACELIPPVSDAELDVLGADILSNGLTAPIAITPDGQLLDGRSRLDALSRKGVTVEIDGVESIAVDGVNKKAVERVLMTISIMIVKTDPVAYVISANLHRRHLTAEQKREIIAELLKATPEKSDRQIAKAVKVDHKTVGAVRAENEGRGEIPHVKARKDTKGRVQPSRKPKARPPAANKSSEADQIERDRKACIALNQKCVEAEEELARVRADQQSKSDGIKTALAVLEGACGAFIFVADSVAPDERLATVRSMVVDLMTAIGELAGDQP